MANVYSIAALLVCLLALVQAALEPEHNIPWENLRRKNNNRPLRHISVGHGGVWALSRSGGVPCYRGDTYDFHTDAGTGWVTPRRDSGRALSDLAVGTHVVWAVAENNTVQVLDGLSATSQDGNEWTVVPSPQGQSFARVTVSNHGHVWALTGNGRVYHRTNATVCNPMGDDWYRTDGALTQISAGTVGVWGVNNRNEVYYRAGTYGDIEATRGTDWVLVEAAPMRHVSSGAEHVWGVGTDGRVYSLRGQEACLPMGSHWMESDARLTTLDSYRDAVWGVNADGAAVRGSLSHLH